MMDFLKILFLLLICLNGKTVSAQQTSLSNFYQYNWQLLNPAAFDRIYIYDKHKNMMLNATYRNQWAWSGIEGAPANYSLSFENIVAKNNNRRSSNRVKWGFNVFKEETHAISNTGIYGNFSYYFPVFDGKNQWLHFGLSPGLVRYGVDLDKITFKDGKDIANINDDQLYADFSFGIFYRHQKKFYFGISVPQTFSLAIASTNTPAVSGQKIAKERLQHIYMTIGGFLNSQKRSRGSSNITIEPSLWLRYVPGVTFNTLSSNLPISGDFSVRAYYNKGGRRSGPPLLWLGTGYGTNRNLKFEVGVTPQLFMNVEGDTLGPDRVRFGIGWELPVGTSGVNLGHSLELNLVYAWNY